MTKVLDVGSSGNSPSAGAKKVTRPQEASGLKVLKKRTEDPSSSNNNIKIDSV